MGYRTGRGTGSEFIAFIACLGQKRAWRPSGYTPLPPNLVELDFQAAGRFVGGGGVTPPPPTAENCPNPTITGALPSAPSRPSDRWCHRPPTGGSTLSVSAPTAGDAWVLAVRVKSRSTDVASVSGGGVGGSTGPD